MISLDKQCSLLLFNSTIYMVVILIWHLEMTACHLWEMKIELLTPLHECAKLTRHCRGHDLSPSGHGISESKGGVYK
jgi:hypothetical protein